MWCSRLPVQQRSDIASHLKITRAPLSFQTPDTTTVKSHGGVKPLHDWQVL